MNISDYNPLGADKVGGNRNISDRQRTESREKVGTNSADRTESRAQEPEEPREPTPARDVFQTSQDRRRLSELADQVQNTDDVSRQERVSRARERAASGYYNSSEFLENLALRLINDGTLR